MKAILKFICLILASTFFLVQNANSQEVFRVERAKQGTYFVINGHKFTARDYCANVKRGDPVQFTEGSPNGFCISGVFINLRTGRECSVWCH